MTSLSEIAIDNAEAAGRLVLIQEARARSARYDPATGRIILDLENGCTYAFPPSLVQDLQIATPSDLAQVTVDGAGFNLHFPTLDVDLLVPALVSGIFGTKAWMTSALARIAGTSRSPAKSQAARANGAKGGRPRKVAAK